VKVGDLVKHKTTGEMGVIVEIECRPVKGGKDLILAIVHKTNGRSFPHPFNVLDLINEASTSGE
jgi:hypothetical protein